MHQRAFGFAETTKEAYDAIFDRSNEFENVYDRIKRGSQFYCQKGSVRPFLQFQHGSSQVRGTSWRTSSTSHIRWTGLQEVRLTDWKAYDSSIVLGVTASLDVVLNTMGDKQQAGLEGFTISLLQIAADFLMCRGNKLWHLTKCLMATLLKDMRVMAVASPESTVLIALQKKALLYGFSLLLRLRCYFDEESNYYNNLLLWHSLTLICYFNCYYRPFPRSRASRRYTSFNST